MKKKLIFILSVLLILLCGSQVVLADSREVLLFSDYNGTQLLAYNDPETHIQTADGSLSAKTAYPADAVFLRGNRLTAISYVDELTVAEHISADTLTRIDLVGLPFSADELFTVDADEYGHIFVVTHTSPEKLYICDKYGCEVKSMSFSSNILGIQVLDGRAYVFLPEKCFGFELDADLSKNSTELFSYRAEAAPYRILNRSIYLSTDGVMYSTDGNELINTGHFALNSSGIAAGDAAIFWVGRDAKVMRYELADRNIGSFTVSGALMAVSESAALVDDHGLRVISCGEFTTESNNTADDPGSTTESVFLYAEPGTTVSGLKKLLNDDDLEVFTTSSRAASGRLRSGWTVISKGIQRTVIVPGDLNGSGTVNSADVRLLQQLIVTGSTASEVQRAAGDLDGNGRLDTCDLVLLVSETD